MSQVDLPNTHNENLIAFNRDVLVENFRESEHPASIARGTFRENDDWSTCISSDLFKWARLELSVEKWGEASHAAYHL